MKKINNWTVNQRMIITLMFSDVRYYDGKRKQMHQIIKNEVLNSEEERKLLSLCSVRLISAFSVMAAVGDINRFKNPKKLVAYFGFTPKCHQSGNSFRPSGISKKGRKDAKGILIQSAQAILNSKNKTGEKLRKWGFALMYRKEKNVAIAAAARKLTAAICYTLKGYLPEILKIDNDIKRKLKKIDEELKLEGLKAIGYDKVKDFIEEYSQIIQLRS